MARKPQRRAHAHAAATADSPARRAAPASRTWAIVVCVALAVAVFAIYGQMRGHAFIAFDDNEYIYENAHVTGGPTAANIAWAFTAFWSNNWHPVTWISHMVDCRLFGLDAGAHHLMGALLHLVNAALVFLLLRRLTGATWRSAFVAGVFAVHPMHVESVAWASERKDVLSTLLALVTLWCYADYATRPSAARYAGVLGPYALGLMAKPMLVTLPFVMLLLDLWPLGRAPGWTPAAAGPRPPKRSLARLALEKAPMLALAIVSSALTVLAQTNGGVVRTLEDVSLPMRVANALVSWVRYAWKLLVPLTQAFYYPYPKQVPVVPAIGAALLLAAVTFWAWRQRHARPWLLVGWLWYAGTLVPVIGLVQVATQAIADRYTYIPSIGLFMAIAWGAAELARARRVPAAMLGAIAAVVVLAFGIKAWAQTRYWQDGVTLFERDAQIVPDDALAYRNLGVEYFHRGRYDDAARVLNQVLRLYPNDEVSLFDLGTAYDHAGNYGVARAYYLQALAIKPEHVDARFNLGLALNKLQQPDSAAAQFREAIRLRPGYAEAYNSLGNATSRAGHDDEAIAAYQEALRLRPDYAEASNNLGTTLKKLGRVDEAKRAYERALQLKPDFAAGHYNLAILEMQRGDTTAARQGFEDAARLDPTLVNPMAPR